MDINRDKKLERISNLVKNTRENLGGIEITLQQIADGLSETVADYGQSFSRHNIYHWINGIYTPKRDRMVLVQKMAKPFSWQHKFASSALSILDDKTAEDEITELGY